MSEDSKARPLVLIVDDEPHIRESLRRFLARNGYRVEEARNVDEATSALRRGGISAMILDVLLPNSGGRSGLDVLASMRAAPALAGVPVFILTGHALNPEVLGRAAALGAELLLKPIEYQALVERLDRAARPGAARPEAAESLT